MKDIRILGNPGEGNSFQENTIQHVNEYYQNASIYKQERRSRMATDFERLRKEITNNVKAEVFEELEYYITELDGNIPVEQKLADGGFSKANISEAVRKKDLYAKRAEKYKYYPSAQQIFFDLFSYIKNEFYVSIFPLIEEGHPLNTVMQALRANIVKPIMKMLNDNGASDEYLHFSEDHIYGMIYYLTGMCHLNWKKYDNV